LVTKDKKEKIYILSDDGKKFTLFVNDYFSSVNRKWDGYLRMVFYDIPMPKSDYRRWLYNNLSLLGYKQIQKSVFIGKYPLPASFIQDISNAELDDYIYISTIKNINNRKEILKLLDD
jgi:DNA-binding transcriptional regulator PaaX